MLCISEFSRITNIIIYNRMDPNINFNQKIEDNNFLIDQKELKENYNDIDASLNPNIKIINLKKKGKDNDLSSDFNNSENFINKKREKPESKEEENSNILNENELPKIPFNSIVFLKNEIQKKLNKKKELEENIQTVRKELNKLDFEIENYEKIGNFLKNFNIDKEVINEGEDEIKNNMNNYVDDSNEDKIFSLNRYSNPLKKLYKSTYLKTLTLKKENKNSDKIENEKYPNFENTSNDNKNLENPFLNMETINEVIANENNKNSSNIPEGIDEYSFRILTNNFHYKISKGTKEISIEFIIENNGKLPWPKDETFFLIDENKSAFKIQKLYLFPLQPGEKCFVYFKFKNLDKSKPGLYKNYFVFNVKGKNLGNDIIIDIEIY